MHHNESGTTQIEKCFNEKLIHRQDAVGEKFDNHFVVCGGLDNSYEPKGDCTSFGAFRAKSFQMIEKGRVGASSVLLNATTMWITGGKNDGTALSSTEYVTLDGSTKGINLPFTVSGHCMVKLDETVILLVGGEQDEKISEKTYVINVTNEFDITEGPSLNRTRSNHGCGILKDEFGNEIVVVVGGNSVKEVELLNISLIEEWSFGKLIIFFQSSQIALYFEFLSFDITGPKLPYEIVNPLISTSIRENKLRLYGTIKKSCWYCIIATYEYKLLELDVGLGKWKEKEFASQTSFKQDYHTSFLLEEDDIDPFCSKVFTYRIAMDEMIFLRMIASNGALRSKQIGTFLHYIVLNAINQGPNQYSNSILSRVKSLLSTDGKDFLLMTKFFGLNDFKNLDFLKPYELANDFDDLSKVYECYTKLIKPSNESIDHEFGIKKSDNRFMSPSPCHSLENYPECVVFCEWHQKISERLTLLEVDTFER